MVYLKKKVISGKTYYYLSHTYRQNGKLKNKETYIGDKLPDTADMIKINNEFLLGIYREKWFKKFDLIKKSYSDDWRRMPKEAKEKFLEDFAVRFTYDTNRIEGSKLSFKDTDELLERHISPKNKPIRDIKEAEAHRKVFYEMIDYKGGLSLETMLKWHGELFGETKPQIAGKIRNYRVFISGSRHLPPRPEEVQQRLSDFFKFYSNEKGRMNVVELAARIHLKFETIHPFGDGNGRIGRVIMNFVLNKNRYPMMNIRYTNRRGYYNALERANAKGDETVFVQWFFRSYIKENKTYLGGKAL